MDVMELSVLHFHLQKLISIYYFSLENQHIYTLPNKVVFSDGLF